MFEHLDTGCLLVISSLIILRASLSHSPSTKLVGWSFFIVFPSLFRSRCTATPISMSESCCVEGHFSRLTWTFISDLLTFLFLHNRPLASRRQDTVLALSTSVVDDVVEHAREDDPVKNLSGACPVYNMNPYLHRGVTKTHVPFTVILSLQVSLFIDFVCHMFPNSAKH